jgi:hypothetical protein
MAATASALRGKRFVYSAERQTLEIEIPAETKTPKTIAIRRDAPVSETRLKARRNSSDGKLH